jgi:hypothetical protein
VWRVRGGALLQPSLCAAGLARAPAGVPAAGGSSGAAGADVRSVQRLQLVAVRASQPLGSSIGGIQGSCTWSEAAAAGARQHTSGCWKHSRLQWHLVWDALALRTCSQAACIWHGGVVVHMELCVKHQAEYCCDSTTGG